MNGYQADGVIIPYQWYYSIFIYSLGREGFWRNFALIIELFGSNIDFLISCILGPILLFYLVGLKGYCFRKNLCLILLKYYFNYFIF